MDVSIVSVPLHAAVYNLRIRAADSFLEFKIGFTHNWWSAYCDAAYMSSPCHIELILSEKEAPVKKEVSLLVLGLVGVCLSGSFTLHD